MVSRRAFIQTGILRNLGDVSVQFTELIQELLFMCKALVLKEFGLIVCRGLCHRYVKIEPIEPGQVLALRELREVRGGIGNLVGDFLHCCCFLAIRFLEWFRKLIGKQHPRSPRNNFSLTPSAILHQRAFCRTSPYPHLYIQGFHVSNQKNQNLIAKRIGHNQGPMSKLCRSCVVDRPVPHFSIIHPVSPGGLY